MRLRWILLPAVALLVYPIPLRAQLPKLSPADKDPILRLETGGPTSLVTALAVSSDGKRLYAGGSDKVVHVWTREDQGRFSPDGTAFRVLVGPGSLGQINAMALSPDGVWLAVGGLGLFRGSPGFRTPGMVLPSIGTFSPEVLQDYGLIYVFNTKTQTVRLLRGHEGPVWALAFVPQQDAGAPILVSVAVNLNPAPKMQGNPKVRRFGADLRAWDLSRAPEENALLAESIPFLVRGEPSRPALAVWRIGERSRQFRAVVAWGDGILRYWKNIDEKSAVAEVPDGANNITAAYNSDQQRLLTGSFNDGKGWVRAWKVNGQGNLQADTLAPIAVPALEGTWAAPRAMTLVSSREDGQRDRAVVISRLEPSSSQRDPAKRGEFRLSVIDVRAEHWGMTQAHFALWPYIPKLPAVTAADRLLAVAGNNENSVHIFPISELFQKTPAFETLDGIGDTFRQIAWVTSHRSKLPGLWLSKATRSQPGSGPPDGLAGGECLFDLANRQLVPSSSEWSPVSPSMGGWSVSMVSRPVSIWAFQPKHQGKDVPATIIKATSILDYALLPPQPLWKVPILAVALMDSAMQPRLYLYNAATGERIRQFTGHTDRINAIAFAPDGRRLASVADDQTVCIWSLANLPKFLGKRGVIRDLALSLQDDALKVLPTPGIPNPLRAGDLIDGFIQEGQFHRVRTRSDFWNSICLLEPGSEVLLRVRGRGDLKVPISQAVDDQKPIISLFLSRGERAQRKWIGWNPVGPYDASDRSAERYLGWHFNTSDPEAPTRFASADQYRNKYYREGILAHIFVQPTLAEALKQWDEQQGGVQLHPPQITIWTSPAGPAPPSNQGEVRVAVPQKRFSVAIDAFPKDRLDSVQWQRDDRSFQPMVSAGDQYSVPLADLEWKMGQRHRFFVKVRTQEAEPREYLRDLTVVYSPPAPRIQLAVSQDHLLVSSPTFTLHATVHPGAADQAVVTHLVQRHEGEIVFQSTVSTPAPDFHQELKLRPGENRLEVIAEDKATLQTPEPARDRVTLSVMYQPPQESQSRPPEVILQRLVLPTAGADEQREIQPGRPVVVTVPKVRLEGTIQAKTEKLAQAEWALGDTKARKPLAEFKAATQTPSAIHEELTLKPGPQVFHVFARTATSPEAHAQATVEYQPPLPHFELREPRAGQEVQHSPEIDLRGKLILSDDPQPFQAAVFVQGREVPCTIDERQMLRARIPLVPLDNRIVIRLSNQWHQSSIANDFHVRYVRPPRDLVFDPPRLGDHARVDLTARVHSVLPITPAQVEAEIDNREIAPDLIHVAGRGDQWQIDLKEIPLEPDKKNQVQLWVSNREGRLPAPGTITIPYQPKAHASASPEIRMLDPAADIQVTDPEVVCRFEVTSQLPLQRLEIVQEDRSPLRLRIDLSREKRVAEGRYLVSRPLHLHAHNNSIRVEAVNADGFGQSSIVINCVALPVRLIVDRLVPLQSGAGPVRPVALPGGKLTFPKVTQSRYWLEGHVVFDEKYEGVDKASQVRITVNGFQQLAEDLAPSQGNDHERRFRSDILFNRENDNQVDIALPDLPRETGSRTRFFVDCARPERSQRLHVLLISPDEKRSPRAFQTRVLELLHAQRLSADDFRTPAFQHGFCYGPLTGFFSNPDHVYTQLHDVRERIENLNQSGSPSNDLFIIYYRGAESVTPDDHLLRMGVSAAAGDPSSPPIGCNALASFLGAMPGAQLLMFDVGRPTPGTLSTPTGPNDRIAHWSDHYPEAAPHVAVLRYAWLGRPEAPRDAGLLEALAESMPRSTRLVDLTQQVHRFASSYPDYLKLLVDSYHVPAPLNTLVLNGKP